MVQYHKAVLTKRKGTGGKRRLSSDKRLANYGGFFTKPEFDKELEGDHRVHRKGKGGTYKTRLRSGKYANVISKDGKIQKAEITNVLESPDNRHFARENMLTKGTLIETALGKARITNRPSQHGIVHAKLV
ncbi:30S ribosomal protein S8e [Candidatus Micrarchaeota archaeon]|nr:30S ribosomal protein S8e [Candidatus Micrarchaeota archaeon]